MAYPYSARRQHALAAYPAAPREHRLQLWHPGRLRRFGGAPTGLGRPTIQDQASEAAGTNLEPFVFPAQIVTSRGVWLRHQPRHNLARYIRQAIVAPLKLINQALVVNTQ